MDLRLKYAPTIENAPRLAADIVAATKRIRGVELDYSIASLSTVDDVLEGFRRGGATSARIAETLFGFGCYVGEIFVRQNSAVWRNAVETKMAGVSGFLFVIQTGPVGPVTFCNPIAKVFKRVDNGIEDSLSFFYEVFLKQAGIPPQT